MPRTHSYTLYLYWGTLSILWHARLVDRRLRRPPSLCVPLILSTGVARLCAIMANMVEDIENYVKDKDLDSIFKQILVKFFKDKPEDPVRFL